MSGSSRFLPISVTSWIEIRGAREHNLTGFDVSLPKRRLVVVSGVSGSGKSSLAFDTLYAEGQRQYVESLTPYARRSLDRFSKPDVDDVRGLSPTIAIRQHKAARNPRSTVATITEIGDYLRLLFSRAGTHLCVGCGAEVRPHTLEELVDGARSDVAGGPVTLLLRAERMRPAVGGLRDVTAEPAGRRSVDWEDAPLDVDLVIAQFESLDGRNLAAFGRVVAAAVRSRSRHLVMEVGGAVRHLALGWICRLCGREALAQSSSDLNSNAPSGMCGDCDGLGERMSVDPESLVAAPDASIRAGALRFFGDRRKVPEKTWWPVRDLPELLDLVGCSIDTPWNAIPAAARDIILNNKTERRLPAAVRRFLSERSDTGLAPEIERLFRGASTPIRRDYYGSFFSATTCTSCRGTGLTEDALAVLLGGHNIAQIMDLPLVEVRRWLELVTLEVEATTIRAALADVLATLRQRIGSVLDIGLDYLTLARRAPSLSAGEVQRLRLARQLGAGLTDLVYVLDEPSIGLHPRDTERLTSSLRALCDIGNTVVVVEHDHSILAGADWLIELGPAAGARGGQLLAAGTVADVAASASSVSGPFLRGERRVERPSQGGGTGRSGEYLEIVGATRHNLAGLTARFPIGQLSCVTGVSGSGKSSLVSQTLYPAVSAAIQGRSTPGEPFESLIGWEAFQRSAVVSQDPIGRSSRSVPATYTGAFDTIRRLFAETAGARVREMTPAHFSFNSAEGQCVVCLGTGILVVGMHFLADVDTVCPQCEGRRYLDEVLDVQLAGRSIADVLALTVEQAVDVFTDESKVLRTLSPLVEVGLGYLLLGQPCSSLSGGEAQRLKISRELAGRTDRHTLYVLDEPTTGLHSLDVQMLIDVVHRLVAAGNTLIVVEHNVDFISTADWIVDLGPGGGEAGGRVIACGSPAKLADDPNSSIGPYLDSVPSDSGVASPNVEAT